VPFFIVAAQISDSMQSTGEESALTLMAQPLAKVIDGIEAGVGGIADGGAISNNRVIPLGGHP